MRKIHSKGLNRVMWVQLNVSSLIFWPSAIVILSGVIISTLIPESLFFDDPTMRAVSIALASGVLYITSAVYGLTHPVEIAGWHEGDETPDDAVESDHGDRLLEVREKIRDKDLEYRAIFDSNGDKIAEGTYLLSHMCNVPRAMWSKVYGNIWTDLHNHPGFFQTSFSGQDFHAMIQDKVRRSVVVTQDFNFIMENPWWNRDDGPDPDAVKKYADYLYGESEGKYNANIICDTFFPWLHACHVSYRTAKHFGLEYRIEVAQPQFRRSRMAIGLLTGLAVTALSMANPMPTSSQADIDVCNCLTLVTDEAESFNWLPYQLRQILQSENEPTDFDGEDRVNGPIMNDYF